METRRRKKEREGEWIQREGASLLYCKGKCCSRGPQEASRHARFMHLQSPVRYPARNGEEARVQTGRMGQEVLPMSRVQAPRNHQTQILQRET